MKDKQDYLQDIAEMRTMMERSSRFLSLSGLAGVLAGIYALLAAYFVHTYLDFVPGKNRDPDLITVVALALVVLVLSIGTAFFLSYRKSLKRGEQFWNSTARRLLINMSVPLIAGGILVLINIAQGQTGMAVPLTLIFYGMSLYTASKFTYEEVRSLGLMQIALGLAAAYLQAYGLLFWAIGFGLLHILYGIYMHYRYER